MFGLMFLSVFKKHSLLNLAIILFALGSTVAYESSGYSYSFWFDSAMVIVIIYEIYELSKNRMKL